MMKFLMGFPDGSVKSPPGMQETQVQSLGWEDPWRREWLPTPVFLLGEFHGQSSSVYVQCESFSLTSASL